MPCKTPTMTNKLHQQATTVRLSDGVTCPTCGLPYSKRLADGTVGLNRPCKHLIAHLGPFGWEQAPDKATSQTKCFAATIALERIAAKGIVTRVTSGSDDLLDEDWLVWSRPTCTALVLRRSLAISA